MREVDTEILINDLSPGEANVSGVLDDSLDSESSALVKIVDTSP